MTVEREAFETALRENRYDTTTRLIYSDFLEEQGEDDYAAEQRRCATKEWCEAAYWMEDFAGECGGTCTNYDSRDEDHIWVPITFEDVVQAGREYIRTNGEYYFLQVGSEHARYLMYSRVEKFWECWQIVTGISVSKGEQGSGVFSCTC